MRKEYDFTDAKKSPYASKLKKQITIKIDVDTINYFKEMSSDTKIPYQTLMNFYLTECAKDKKKINISFS